MNTTNPALEGAKVVIEAFWNAALPYIPWLIGLVVITLIFCIIIIKIFHRKK